MIRLQTMSVSLIAFILSTALTFAGTKPAENTINNNMKQNNKILYKLAVFSKKSSYNNLQLKAYNAANKAVENNMQKYLDLYLLKATTIRDKDGKIIRKGTSDLQTAMNYGPLHIDEELAKSLFPSYAGAPWGKAIYSEATYTAGRAIVAELYMRALRFYSPDGSNSILFMAGGVSNGKTYILHHNKDVKELAQKSQIYIDQVMGSAPPLNAEQEIELALAAGKDITIIYVYTPYEQAVKWLVKRVAEGGHLVPAWTTATSHWGTPQIALQLAEKYKNNPHVHYYLLDNTPGTDNSKLQPISALKEKLAELKKRFVSLDTLITYTKKLIKTDIQQYNAKHPEHLIPQEVIDAFQL